MKLVLVISWVLCGCGKFSVRLVMICFGWGFIISILFVRYRVLLMLWVMNSIVVWICVYMFSSKVCIFSWVCVLRVLKGLFISSRCGWLISIWVIFMCCCIFLDSWLG